MTENPEVVNVTICVADWRFQLDAVYTVITDTPPLLNVFTRHAGPDGQMTEVDHVISLPLANVLWWAERPCPGPLRAPEDPAGWT